MKILKWTLGIICLLLLVSVRLFEDALFQDPLVIFFQSKFSEMTPPLFEKWKLIGTMALRYFINTVLSLTILFLSFNKSILKFSLMIYAMAFIVFISLFYYLVSPLEAENYMKLFYVRRFLIQPLFLILLLPAFYYQQNIKKTSS